MTFFISLKEKRNCSLSLETVSEQPSITKGFAYGRGRCTPLKMTTKPCILLHQSGFISGLNKWNTYTKCMHNAYVNAYIMHTYTHIMHMYTHIMHMYCQRGNPLTPANTVRQTLLGGCCRGERLSSAPNTRTSGDVEPAAAGGRRRWKITERRHQGQGVGAELS